MVRLRIEGHNGNDLRYTWGHIDLTTLMVVKFSGKFGLEMHGPTHAHGPDSNIHMTVVVVVVVLRVVVAVVVVVVVAVVVEAVVVTVVVNEVVSVEVVVVVAVVVVVLVVVVVPVVEVVVAVEVVVEVAVVVGGHRQIFQPDFATLVSELQVMFEVGVTP
eukprot:CAMPEP_0115366300 /NCGR_PEP_ID=MMETSP0270-20121206/104737_1 /TAXON_ID=71861 /ORGANISM="Scrippsiella trochoidea, Strain CCMP3099" /LENGTH=159 /DNA_ID=CAMNT_0002789073 /DNA_START=216 /DNA_END=692 /DNA_ORIENTATION=+